MVDAAVTLMVVMSPVASVTLRKINATGAFADGVDPEAVVNATVRIFVATDAESPHAPEAEAAAAWNDGNTPTPLSVSTKPAVDGAIDCSAPVGVVPAASTA